MPNITVDEVKAIRDKRPKRCCFAQTNVVTERDGGQYCVSLRFPALGKLFAAETGIVLKSGPFGPYGYLTAQAQIDAALAWQADRAELVFLRDALTSSVALGFNLASAGVYTDLGHAEHDAKANRNAVAIAVLAKACATAINSLAFYKECTGICAVPPSPDKEWDLPSELAHIVAKQVRKADISPALRFSKKKASVKELSLDEKWDALEAAKLQININVTKKKIILLDDKYQSGTTAQFIASKLFDAGATEVHGLFCVKTWRDTDNK
jgi:predicted amidophosphoribosyltransferase